jgi:hypothetical protein
MAYFRIITGGYHVILRQCISHATERLTTYVGTINSRVFFQVATVTQLFEKLLPFMKPQGSSTCSQASFIRVFARARRTQSTPHYIFLSEPFYFPSKPRSLKESLTPAFDWNFVGYEFSSLSCFVARWLYATCRMVKVKSLCTQGGRVGGVEVQLHASAVLPPWIEPLVSHE